MQRILEALRREQGGFDLMSTLVGVLVVGIIGAASVVSVTSVIPWTQDNASKATLGAIGTAQSAYSGANKRYADYATLQSLKLVPSAEAVQITTDIDGGCYMAMSRSVSGNLFWRTEELTKPQQYGVDKAPTTNKCENYVHAAALKLSPSLALPAPTPTPTAIPVGNANAVYLTDPAQKLVYSVEPNGYNKQQLLLNVTITGGDTTKRDWELKVNTSDSVSTPFNQILSFAQVNDTRVSEAQNGTLYTFKNTALGEYGNTVSTNSSFSTTILFNFAIKDYDEVSSAMGAPSGGPYYASQRMTVSTTSKIYVYWKIRVDLTQLKSLASKTGKIVINDTNLKITHDVDNYYWVQPLNDNFAIKSTDPVSFDIAATN